MLNSEQPESQNSPETEPSAVTDSSQIEQQEPKLQPSQKQRWPLIVGIILLVAGVGFGWRWWQTSMLIIQQQGICCGGSTDGNSREVSDCAN